MNKNIEQCLADLRADPCVPATVLAAFTALARGLQELGWIQQDLEDCVRP